MKSKTRKILGIPVRLVVGRRYRATRPLGLVYASYRYLPGKAEPQILTPVRIYSLEKKCEGLMVLEVGLMTRGHADRFLNAFNNGKSSFEGRVWR